MRVKLDIGRDILFVLEIFEDLLGLLGFVEVSVVANKTLEFGIVVIVVFLVTIEFVNFVFFRT